MLFARKMVAPTRLSRAKQGHPGWRWWQGSDGGEASPGATIQPSVGTCSSWAR